MTRPVLGLTCGDPAGIGPEIVRDVVADRKLASASRLVVFGPAGVRPAQLADGVEWVATEGPDQWAMGVPQEACGRAALAALRAAHDAACDGRVDALVTAPVSKEALHLAGERVEGQTALFARWTGASVEMMAVAGDLRVLLLTRHLALREALARITAPAVESHLVLLDRTLRAWGWDRPRLALAGLNPHAGESGLFGDEEPTALEPALRAARARGIDVVGPAPPDTVFLRALQGSFDGVLALYHDQAFLPVKIAAPNGALTVLCGLPYLRISPAHGTAFDIAGQGLASSENMKAAVREAARWVARRGPRGHLARAASAIDRPSG